MKNGWIVLLLLLAFLSELHPACAGQQRTSSPVARISGDCLSTGELQLSEEQRSAIARIESQYKDRVNRLQNRLMGKRLEMQQGFRDPEINEANLRAKAVEVSDLQRECLQAMLDFQLAVRALLSPDQLRIWCASTEPCLTRWSGKPQCTY
ncbi:MAG: periplasmic heavy metal sensor [Desulfobacteraceae bacterium]|nr:periplasmic heavy metal sensor [Desulfobacteraceae bacterium]